MKTNNPETEAAKSGSSPADCSLPTPEEIAADPDRILELLDECPNCRGKALEALTWKSLNLADITVGCWNPDCGWIQIPDCCEQIGDEIFLKQNA